jgi:thermitase
MKSIRVLCVLAVATSVLLCGPGIASAQGQGQGPANMQPKKHIPGRVLVQPRPGLSMEEFDKILKPHGGRRGAIIRQLNVHIIELPPQANAPAIAEALRRNPHIKFAEVDGAVAPDFLPNDPQYSSAWHLPKIGAPTAWDTAQGSGTTIAILDTGIDAVHPDLQSQIVPGWNFYDNNNNVADVHGHGTSVAGVAAAAGNNGVGTASVSFRSKIMPMRVTDTTGWGYYSMMAAALTAAADSGARVANISFLGVSASSTVDSAAQYMRSKGGIVVVSGGNTGALVTDPQRISLTAVAATDRYDARAIFSSWGNHIDIAAPGVSILTTMRGDGYGWLSGTSAASPVVAGVYALMMSANPGLAPASLDNILFTTTLDLGTGGFDQQFGHGRVQAAEAVSKAIQTSTGDTQAPTVAIAAPPSGAILRGLIPVDVNATDNVGVARVELYATGSLVATDTLSPFGFTLDTSQYQDGPLNLQARAYDAAGNSASSSTVAVTVANDVTPPTVTITSPASGSTVSGTVPITVSATDDQKVAKIALSIDGKEVSVSYGSSLTYSWSVPSRKGGKKQTSSTIRARAEDTAGNAATATVTVTRK